MYHGSSYGQPEATSAEDERSTAATSTNAAASISQDAEQQTTKIDAGWKWNHKL
jgi:hypothetical protein